MTHPSTAAPPEEHELARQTRQVLDALRTQAVPPAAAGDRFARQVVNLLAVIEAVLDEHPLTHLPGNPPAVYCAADVRPFPCATTAAIIRTVLTRWPPPPRPGGPPPPTAPHAPAPPSAQDTVSLPRLPISRDPHARPSTNAADPSATPPSGSEPSSA